MKPFNGLITSPDAIADEKQKKKIKIKILPLLNPDGRMNGMYMWNDLFLHMEHISEYTVDANGNFIVCAAIGFGEEDIERAHLLVNAGCDIIVMDSSHDACLECRRQPSHLRTPLWR